MENEKLSIIPDSILPHVHLDQLLLVEAEKVDQHIRFLESVEHDTDMPIPAVVAQPIENILGRRLDVDQPDKVLGIQILRALKTGIVAARIVIQDTALKVSPGTEDAFSGDANNVAGLLGPVAVPGIGIIDVSVNANALRRGLES